MAEKSTQVNYDADLERRRQQLRKKDAQKEQPSAETTTDAPPPPTESSTTEAPNAEQTAEAPKPNYPPHYAEKYFRCVILDLTYTFQQNQIIEDQYQLFHLLRLEQPIKPVENCVQCPKCQHVFEGKPIDAKRN